MSSDVVPAAPSDLLDHTYNVLHPLWFDNVARNLQQVREGNDLKDLPKQKGKPCICIGGGPSLSRYRHLFMIAKSGWKHTILCCDKEIRACLKHKIKPYAVASVDGSPIIAKFYQHKLVKKHSETINAAFNALVHPNVVKAWNGPIYWFLNMIDHVQDEEGRLKNKSVTYILNILTRMKSMVSTIGNVGSFLWNLAYVLECDPVILVGYDFSEQVKDKADAIYFNAFVEMFLPKFPDPNEAMDKAAALHQVERNPDFDHYYLVNPIWKTYRELLKGHIVSSKKHTINATGNGCLHTEAIKCDNFEAMPLKKVLKEFK